MTETQALRRRLQQPPLLHLFSVAMCLLLVAGQAALAATIDGVRVQKTSDATRFVFDLSEPVDFRVFSLDNPRRVVVDFRSARPRAGLSLSSVPLMGTPVTAIRGGPQAGGDYRIVLDVSAPLSAKGTELPPSGGNRVAVELVGKTAAAVEPLIAVEPVITA